MKIRNYSGSVQELQKHLSQVNSKGNNNQEEIRSVNSDAVNIAPTLRTENSDPARKARIAEIKDSISGGRYSPDSKEVAKALIRDLLG